MPVGLLHLLECCWPFQFFSADLILQVSPCTSQWTLSEGPSKLEKKRKKRKISRFLPLLENFPGRASEGLAAISSDCWARLKTIKMNALTRVREKLLCSVTLVYPLYFCSAPPPPPYPFLHGYGATGEHLSHHSGAAPGGALCQSRRSRSAERTEKYLAMAGDKSAN